MEPYNTSGGDMNNQEIITTAIGVALMVTPKGGRMGEDFRPHLFVQSAIFGTAVSTQASGWATLGAAIVGAVMTWLLNLVSKGIIKRLIEVEKQVFANTARLKTLACPFAVGDDARCSGSDHPLAKGEQLPHEAKP